MRSGLALSPWVMARDGRDEDVLLPVVDVDVPGEDGVAHVRTREEPVVAREEPGDGAEELGGVREEPGDGAEGRVRARGELGQGDEEPGGVREEPGDGVEELDWT